MKISATDQMGRKVECAFPPQRIVSLVPSQTEFLADLGLENEVVGITRFCIHPAHWYRHKTRIGGTKNVDLQKVRMLRPDLIIGNKEENDESQILQLSSEFPVWISDIKNLSHALAMMEAIGELTQRSEKAREIVEGIAGIFNPPPAILPRRRAAYLIWNDPLMTVSGDTFIHDMLERCGLVNVFSQVKDARYPQVEEADLLREAPDFLLLSTEPYPFKEAHVSYFQHLLPSAKVILADGEMFSWYGSRLLSFNPAVFL